MTRAIVLIAIALFMALSLCAQEVTGNWYGKIGTGKNAVQFVFHVTEEDGEFRTTMDIPTRSLSGIKTQKTNFEENRIHIDGKNFGFEYVGVFNPGNVIINGHFKEGVTEVPLKLTKEKPELSKARVRPQEPIRPYPYQEEEVSFENGKDQITLAGTLTLPIGKGKYPAVILISGSGPQNRDEEIFGHKPFLVLADHLTRLGIAVLRYDDRGVNESTGDFTDATTGDFATDVESAIAYLKTRKDIDQRKIGLIGHSEGGIIAPLVAVNSNDVDFLVLLAGTGVSGYQTVLRQSVDLRGFSVPDEEAFRDYMIEVLNIASSEKDVELVRTELTEYYDKAPFFNSIAGEGEQRAQLLKNLVEARTSKWIRYFYNYNPADMLERVKCPVLSINGTKDIQVLADVNQAGIRAALEKGKNNDFQVIALEGLNHFFQEAETGAMNEYDDIEETFSPKALKVISAWILKRVN